jgi:hypothetical protein
MAGRRDRGTPPADPLAAVDAAILKLGQMDACVAGLRATAPRAVAGLGDLTPRMRPTAIGFMVELTAEEWEAIAIEHQLMICA